MSFLRLGPLDTKHLSNGYMQNLKTDDDNEGTKKYEVKEQQQNIRNVKMQ